MDEWSNIEIQIIEVIRLKESFWYVRTENKKNGKQCNRVH